ncbi:hypothetical protein RhiirC2_790099 [Rhizophagus irregularis]|uniref:Uncharacterized protein n=1 Tax=Rhizophagus irregularis TaxID=588596 RepID=A0A2N1MLY7_9GLOM|nr:hypothetical protein RhiirC2_790099 [Rhizophagus irregularis]
MEKRGKEEKSSILILFIIIAAQNNLDSMYKQYHNEYSGLLDNLQILAINITFGTITNTSNKDVSASPVSVALLEKFEIKIMCDVILKDIDKNIDYMLSETLICNMKKMLYISILTETIQGPLKEFIQELIYDFLHLPLRLFLNKEVNTISSYLINTHEDLKNYVNKNGRTVQRCVSDLDEYI